MDNDKQTGAPVADPSKRTPFAASVGTEPGRDAKPADAANPDLSKPSVSALPGTSDPHPSSHASGLAKPEPAKSEPRDDARGHVGLPVAEPFQGFSAPLPKERTGVFNQLVTDDGDIAGLVAYSIYKQNKLDWLSAFEAAKGRGPSDDELASYIIGEGTPRRIATYRHLAEATLAGNGPRAGGASVGQRVGPRGSLRRVGPVLGDKSAMIATYAVIALLFLIGFLVAAHYTMSSR